MSGKGEAKRKLESVKEFLKNNRQTFRSLEIDKPTPISKIPSDGKILIKKAVICLGGDGTVSETLGYIINHEINKPIAVIPTGTANIIAATLRLNKNISSFEFLINGETKSVDVGIAQFQDEKDCFLLGLGLGFEEKFLKLTKDRLKNKFGVFSYLLAALAELISLKSIPITINGNKINVCLLTVFNLQPVIFNFFPLFSNGEIKGNDGVLNLYYIEYKNYLNAFLGTLLFHLFGRKNFGLVKTLSGKEFKIESPISVGTQIDGELRGNLPVEISLLEKRCEFLF